MKRLLPLILCLATLAAEAAPYVPASGSKIIETLPGRSNPAQKEIDMLRAQVRAAPNDVQLATALARRYISLGRSETDPRYFGYAQAALAPWWNSKAPPHEVRLLRATLLQSTHHFPEAMADLDAITRSDPANAQAWLTRATIQTVQGDYEGATRSCARLSALASQLASFACLGNAAGVSGRLAASERLLGQALARDADAPADEQAWVLTMLAEMATRRGDARTAEAHYRSALAISPRDSYLIGAYADFLLDRKRPREAAALLRDHRRIDALLLRYALALQQQAGSKDELTAAIKELDARFGAAMQRGDSVHQREQARYTLHLRRESGAALALAKQNWAVQKEPADTRLVLEAALGAGDRAAAAPVLEWIEKTGLEDVAIAALVQRLKASP
ncbi:MAG TPA: tetratricopeptide repeat protein [Telluria sp.]